MPNQQKIVIVDDEEWNIQIITQVLDGVAKIASAKNGKDALTLLSAPHTDVLFMDVIMPGLNGYEMCVKLRQDPRFKFLKIILVSACASVEEKLRGYQAGADDYITKPFIPSELLAKARVYLKLAQSERELRDINAELEAQVKLRTEQLLHSEKLAYLGTHTAEIVHDLKSPLTILKGMTRMLNKRAPSPELVKMDHAIDRIELMIRTILRANYQDAEEGRELDLRETIDSELKLLEMDHFYRNKVEVCINLPPLAPVFGRTTNFSQIFGNLLKNAVEAMYSSETRILTIDGVDHDDCVVVSISDTGCGIAASHIAKIFDPFFTTKPLVSTQGEPIGTGLGLSSVKRMVEAYGGSIDIASEVGRGTKISVALPHKCARATA